MNLGLRNIEGGSPRLRGTGRWRLEPIGVHSPFDHTIGPSAIASFRLRQAGETAQLERINRIYEAYKVAYKEMRGSFYERFDAKEASSFPGHDFNQERGAYYETLSIQSLGISPHPELYQRLADLREKMGRIDEARAWHRLVLRDSAENAVSLAALRETQVT